MRAAVGCAVLAFLAGCSQQPSAQALERQYELMKSAGNSPDELCRKAGEVASAWLAREDKLEYQIWHSRAALDCNRGALDRLAG